MRLQIIFLLAVLVRELPVVLGLSELGLGGLHLVKHNAELVGVLANEGLDFLLFADIVTLVLAEKGAVGADASLAARQADQLLGISVFMTRAKSLLHLLFLLLLYLHLGLGEAVLEVGNAARLPVCALVFLLWRHLSHLGQHRLRFF